MRSVLAPRSNFVEAEWALRVQLAGAYRIAHHLGWAELIYTHISARVPGSQHHFLINPYGLRFDEVTASNLVKVNADGETVGQHQYGANRAGFIIHSAVHMAREDAACVFHTHTLAGMAVSAQEEGLLPVHMSTSPMMDKGEVASILGVVTDLSEQMRAHEELQGLAADLEDRVAFVAEATGPDGATVDFSGLVSAAS